MILVGLGSLALFLGVIMIAGRLIRPLVAIVGGPARRFGGPPGRLASGNSTRNTTRTATTAAALMIGLALVTLVATMASGFRASGRSADEKTVKADYVVTSKSGFDTIPAEVGAAVARAPGVTEVSAVRHDEAKAFGQQRQRRRHLRRPSRPASSSATAQAPTRSSRVSAAPARSSQRDSRTTTASGSAAT